MAVKIVNKVDHPTPEVSVGHHEGRVDLERVRLVHGQRSKVKGQGKRDGLFGNLLGLVSSFL